MVCSSPPITLVLVGGLNVQSTLLISDKPGIFSQLLPHVYTSYNLQCPSLVLLIYTGIPLTYVPLMCPSLFIYVFFTALDL